MSEASRGLVVVGVDFSDGSNGALVAARGLGLAWDADLHLVHVREPGADAREIDPDGEYIAVGPGPSSPLELRVRIGDPWIELAREAIAVDALAIVLGSHGRSGFQPIELGSTAARVGLIAPCPVVVIGPRARRPLMTSPARPLGPAFVTRSDGEDTVHA